MFPVRAQIHGRGKASGVVEDAYAGPDTSILQRARVSDLHMSMVPKYYCE